MGAKCCFNRDRLLAFHFREGDERELVRVKRHVEQCPECRLVIADLRMVETALQRWPDVASPDTALDGIMERIATARPPAPPLPARPRPSVLAAKPFFQIVAVIFALLFVIGWLGRGVKLLPWWQTVSKWGVMQLFGPAAVAVFLIFILGTIVTLALSPILIWETEAKRNK